MVGKNIVQAQGDLDLFQDTWEWMDEKSNLTVFSWLIYLWCSLEFPNKEIQGQTFNAILINNVFHFEKHIHMPHISVLIRNYVSAD